MSGRFLCIEFPRWPVQRWMVERSLPSTAAVVLHEPDARRGQRVVEVSWAAEARGVRRGMSMAEAAALMARENVPHDHLQCGAADPRGDRERLVELAAECRRFAPLVVWDLSDPPTGLGLAIHATARRWGGESALMAAVAQWVQELGLKADLVVADTLSAAWACARWGGGRRVGVSSAESTGLGEEEGRLRRILEPGEAGAENVASGASTAGTASSAVALRLPVQALRLPEPVERILGQLGLHCLGDLARLPRAALASRLGLELIDRLDQLLGRRMEASVACPPRWVGEETWEGEFPLDDRQQVLAICERLWKRLGARLYERGEGALQVVYQLRCVEGEELEMSVGMFAPTADVDCWMRQTRARAEQLVLPGPVRRVRLVVVARQRVTYRTLRLWGEDDGWGSDEQRRLWSEWVTRVSNRLGGDRVLRAVPRVAHLPEDAWQAVEWTDGSGVHDQAEGRNQQRRGNPGKGNQAAQTVRRGVDGSRPAWVCDPRPIAVTVDGPLASPMAVVVDGVASDVALAAGPERIETKWWRGPCARRDYYRLWLVDGRRLWVFHQRPQGPWYLHGYFG